MEAAALLACYESPRPQSISNTHQQKSIHNSNDKTDADCRSHSFSKGCRSGRKHGGTILHRLCPKHNIQLQLDLQISKINKSQPVLVSQQPCEPRHISLVCGHHAAQPLPWLQRHAVDVPAGVGAATRHIQQQENKHSKG